MSNLVAETHVLLSVRNEVATVLFNRPESRNAWSPEMERAYFDALQAACDDPGVRAIVVAGAGRAFCAGPDLDLLSPDTIGEFERDPRGDQFATTLPKPVIAAIDGACVGIGLSVALMCDIRFVTPQVKMTTGFVRIGLIAEHGTSWLLQRLGSPAVALDLLLSSRVVRGEEALRLGLANFVADDALAAAQTYAEGLAAASSPTAMAVIKSQVYADSATLLDDAVAEADRLVEIAASSEDFTKGVTAMIAGEPISHGPLHPTEQTGSIR